MRAKLAASTPAEGNDAAGPSGAGQSSSGAASLPATHAPARRRVIGTTADGDGEHAPVIIPPDDSPATATSASPATRSAAPTAGSSAHVILPDVNHICRIPGCVRRATDTEHGNHTLCCDRCSYTDGRFHTAVCDAADYDLTASSSSTVSAPVGTTDRNGFIPGWHNYNSEDNKLHPFSDVPSSTGYALLQGEEQRGLVDTDAGASARGLELAQHACPPVAVRYAVANHITQKQSSTVGKEHSSDFTGDGGIEIAPTPERAPPTGVPASASDAPVPGTPAPAAPNAVPAHARVERARKGLLQLPPPPPPRTQAYFGYSRGRFCDPSTNNGDPSHAGTPAT